MRKSLQRESKFTTQFEFEKVGQYFLKKYTDEGNFKELAALVESSLHTHDERLAFEFPPIKRKRKKKSTTVQENG